MTIIRSKHLLKCSWIFVGQLCLLPLTHGFLHPNLAGAHRQRTSARPSSSSSVALELLGMDKALALPADQLSYEVQGAAKQLLVACVYNDLGAEGLNREALDAPNAQLNELLAACVDKAPALVTLEGGLLYLARFAAWVPRDQWVRPLEGWVAPDAKTLSSPEEQVCAFFQKNSSEFSKFSKCLGIPMTPRVVAARYLWWVSVRGVWRAS